MSLTEQLVESINLSEDQGYFSYACKKKSLNKIKDYVKWGKDYRASCMNALEEIFLDIPTDCLNIVAEYVSDFPRKRVDLTGSRMTCETPIHSAAKAGRIDIVRYLLSMGIHIEQVNVLGETPLYVASLAGQTEMVKVLLANGANDADDELVHFFQKPLYPLIAAAGAGHLDTVIALLKSSKVQLCIYRVSMLNHPPFEFPSALMSAIMRGHVRVVRYLLQMGFPTHENTKYGNIYDAAVEYGSVRLLDIIVKSRHCSLDIENMSGVTPLIAAAYYNNLPMVEYLIKKKVKLLKANKHGITAYGWACSNGNLSIMKALEKAGGADTHCKEWNGLFSAVRYNKVAAVQHMLERGVSLNVPCVANGYTPLHYAAYMGHDQMIKLLIEYGANVNASTHLKQTPLYLAVSEGHILAVKELLKHKNYMTRVSTEFGLNVPMVCIYKMNHVYDTLDKYTSIFSLLNEHSINLVVRPPTVEFGKVNIVEYALLNKRYDIFHMLVDNIKYINSVSPLYGYTLLHVACFYSAPYSVVETIINKGGNVNATSLKGHTPLYCALYRKSDDIVELLLEKGAKPDISITCLPLIHYAMLQYAEESSIYSMVTSLLEKGANILSTDELCGSTSLMVSSSINNIILVKCCMMYGCPIDAQNISGYTALMLAAAKGNIVCVEELVKRGADMFLKNKLGKNALLLATENNHGDVIIFLANSMNILYRNTV